MKYEPAQEVIEAIRLIVGSPVGKPLTKATQELVNERRAYMDEVARLRLRDLELRAEVARLRAAIGQAISDAQKLVNLNDEPHIDMYARHIADILGAALEETP